jgi:hypothetical protein
MTTTGTRSHAAPLRRWSIVVCALALALSDGNAGADVLVLDVCIKQCDESDLRVIDNIRRVFQTDQRTSYLIAAPEDVLFRIGRNAPLPGAQDPLLTVEKLEKMLKDGLDKWASAHVNNTKENEEAAKCLAAALAMAVENPAIVFSDPRLRLLIQRAYIGWAISLVHLKRAAAANEAIADMVRATSDASILDSWGTDAESAFQLSRRELIARGVGSLTIEVDDPNVVFYFNATGQPHKGVFAAQAMLPGVYQVFMTDPSKRSRRFSVEVVPRGHAVLNVDWRRDTAFEVPSSTAKRIGYTFSSFAERRYEANYASHVATQVPGSLVVVVSRIMWEGKQAMIGAMYGPDAVPFRAGVVLGTDLASARDLGAFLTTSKKPAPSVIPLTTLPWVDPSPTLTHADDARLPSLGKWCLAGGIAAIVAGSGLYALDKNGDRNTAPYGLALGVAGVAAVGVGVGIWLRGTTAPPAGPLVSVGASHAMVGWAGTFD